mmetsp:Transcript_24374/g.51241  ORF Transcript_24374/g.51241 Transcript_24374/m.51241 type:complete len:85 (+) Transcript_24374:71-325(+)
MPQTKAMMQAVQVLLLALLLYQLDALLLHLLALFRNLVFETWAKFSIVASGQSCCIIQDSTLNALQILLLMRLIFLSLLEGINA